MRHFTYEIDERNLRLKLKDMEAPMKEGAWESFEEFSGMQERKSAGNKMNLKFSLNRNVLVLAVFGAVIISFSLLLFNFISIKNPKKDTVPNLEENKAMASEKAIEPEPKPQPVVVKTVPVPTVATVKDTLIVKKENLAEVKSSAPVSAPPIVEAKVKEVPLEEMNGEELQLALKKAEELRLKKERKAAAALAKSIKPAIVTEDTDPDVKPE